MRVTCSALVAFALARAAVGLAGAAAVLDVALFDFAISLTYLSTRTGVLDPDAYDAIGPVGLEPCGREDAGDRLYGSRGLDHDVEGG